ncbi:MAG: hypothetical protein ACLGSD_00120 [Acidobacteriota bacterium]
MKRLNSDELHETIHRALEEVDRRLASGELDGSGRFYTDEELAAGAATGRSTPKPQSKAEEPAA